MTATVSGSRLVPVALACAGLLLAACGASPRSAAGPATAPATSRATGAAASPLATGATACPAAGLAASVGAAGAAGGTMGMPVDFANETGHACLMDGYPTAWFETGEAGARVGPSAAPFVGQGGRQRVTVTAGGSAHFWLLVPTAADWPAHRCHQVTTHWLRVAPPGTSATLEVALPYGVAVCSDPASGFDLTVMPVRPGRGIVGHTP